MVSRTVPRSTRRRLNLGVRAYTAARIGTQDTDVKICSLVGGKVVCGRSTGTRRRRHASSRSR
ncbi:MAG: hypothetical protein U0802_03340 [Candidatus Binatia bacterium]